MMTGVEFERRIKGATSHGTGSSLKSAGTTATIALALKAYDESVLKGQAQVEQASYLYQVLKNCNKWLDAKVHTTGGNTNARKEIINLLRREAVYTLRNQYPLVQQALDLYETRKRHDAWAQNDRTLTPLKKVYAHERTAYTDYKAQGQFHDPGLPRFTPSATIMDGNFGGKKISKAFGGKAFEDLDFDEYMKLDKLLGRQYKVLYMSKFERLSYMVAPEGQGANCQFMKVIDNTVFNMPGTSVEDDLACGSFLANIKLYACDKAGNIFITDGDIKDKTGNALQVNHSTLLAGADCLCAGTISIKNGKLRGISNLSGHYKPDTSALTSMVLELQNQGVDIRNVVVVDMARNDKTEGANYLAGKYGKFPPMWKGSVKAHLDATT